MTFRAPTKSHLFALDTVGYFDLAERYFRDFDRDTLVAILQSAATFSEVELAPLNRKGDIEGARHTDDGVISAPGFAAAYREFVNQGWGSLSAEAKYGGQGLPKAVELSIFEMMSAANMAFALCPMLTFGAIDALVLNGTERQKSLIVPMMVSGEWTGTMNMTEPQAGSDLSALTTRAEPDGRGGYLLTGQKIFITWGDHDVADNICHLVLARTPDAPPGVKGISLFLATKKIVNEDGTLGSKNSIYAASTEHKLGIHASPTCVMIFDGAEAELVGQLGQGLAHMFVMMNNERLLVGAQSVGIAERAFQQALDYSKTRAQGHPIWGGGSIYGHPDVRRSLMLMKAKIEGARAICLYTAVLADIAHLNASPEDQARARMRRELLTPIAKGWCSNMAVDVTSEALQVHGGMGFIEETGAAQHFRDARITPIYEGTNAIQALDLVGRKIRKDQGEALHSMCVEMRETANRLAQVSDLAPIGAALKKGIGALERATRWVVEVDQDLAITAATPFLSLAGNVICGWMLGLGALKTREVGQPQLAPRVSLARLYASQVLALADSVADAVTDTTLDLKDVSAEDLADLS
jgi:alkylation response protein AidB-like acyl-CoA dehydrogenase